MDVHTAGWVLSGNTKSRVIKGRIKKIEKTVPDDIMLGEDKDIISTVRGYIPSLEGNLVEVELSKDETTMEGRPVRYPEEFSRFVFYSPLPESFVGGTMEFLEFYPRKPSTGDSYKFPFTQSLGVVCGGGKSIKRIIVEDLRVLDAMREEREKQE